MGQEQTSGQLEKNRSVVSTNFPGLIEKYRVYVLNNWSITTRSHEKSILVREFSNAILRRAAILGVWGAYRVVLDHGEPRLTEFRISCEGDQGGLALGSAKWRSEEE
jgi:hypothetical protein